MAFEINIAAADEADLFYSQVEKDRELGCIGHLRGDFGRSGNEFWHTWWEHQSNLKTQDFKDEFDLLVNFLRKQGLLKDRSSMAQYCFEHREAGLPGAWHSEVYGFRVDTERHRYYIRCFPQPGDYNFYIYCYKNERERLLDNPERGRMRPAPQKKKHVPER